MFILFDKKTELILNKTDCCTCDRRKEDTNDDGEGGENVDSGLIARRFTTQVVLGLHAAAGNSRAHIIVGVPVSKIVED